jgi:actin-related protein
MTQVMFETFDVPAFYCATTSTLSLYASGRTTGIVLDSGHSVTHAGGVGHFVLPLVFMSFSIVPIYEGFTIPHAIVRQEFAGRDLTDYLLLLLNARGHGPFAAADLDSVRALKEALLSVALNFDETMAAPLEDKSYQLPDGRLLALGKELFECAEGVFQPHRVVLAHAESLFERLRLLYIGRDDPLSGLFNVPKDVVRLIQAHYLAMQRHVDSRRYFTTLRRLQTSQSSDRATSGIHSMIFDAGMKCDVDTQPLLWKVMNCPNNLIS